MYCDAVRLARSPIEAAGGIGIALLTYSADRLMRNCWLEASIFIKTYFVLL